MANQLQKKRKRRYAAPIGGVFVVLAVIGVVTVVVSSIRLTFNFLDNDREKRMFEDVVRPVVMFNPVPFENPVDIEMESLLRYSMWSALTGEKRSSYEFADNTELIVPASDLDVAAARLFGQEVVLEHQQFGDIDVQYVYEESDHTYIVPVSAQLLVYSPRVVDIKKDGEFLDLYVGYVPPETAWTQSSGAEPDKYMVYVVRKSGENYQIARVRDVTEEELSVLEAA